MLWVTSMTKIQPGLPDFTILTLNRNVEPNVPILAFSTVPPSANSALWSAGYPRGLPLKYGVGISSPVNLANNNLRVRHNITTFPGNSGSPIFTNNNQVVAVHVRGPKDAGFETYKKDANGSITCPVYQAVDHNEDTWAEGFRTDYVRWLFNRDARTVLDITFEAATIPSDTAPCHLRIWVRVNYARDQPEPAPILTTTIDLDARRQWQVNISDSLKQGLTALNKYPAEVRGIKFELLQPTGQPRLQARRQLQNLSMTIGSGVRGRENVEYVHFYEEGNGKVMDSNRPVSEVVFQRVLVAPIHF
jgi:hypothetical protein